MEELSLEKRKELLEREIGIYGKRGFHVVTRTDTTAQLMRPKHFSCLWATLWFLVFGVGLLIYAFYYLSKSDEVVNIFIDEYGQVRRR
jgi:hypothetical protein